MKIDVDTGLLDSARYIASDNADERSDASATELIVIHNISLPPGEFAGHWVEDFFTNQLDTSAHPYFAEIAHLRVSSHLYIRRDGQIIQFVPFHRRAWHAGVSCYQGREACNEFSIGIELEGTDDIPYSDAQYQSLAAAVTALVACYPQLTKNKITGHCDIAPNRKTDPGKAFDWARLAQLLNVEAFEPA